MAIIMNVGFIFESSIDTKKITEVIFHRDKEDI